MRIEQLEQLIQINQWSSMNIAAQYLHMTHQNLSRSMKQLEEELNITIFSRTNKGSVLTIEGEKLLEFAIAVVNEQSKLFSSLHQRPYVSTIDSTAATYHLNVALTSSMHYVFNPLLYNIMRQDFTITTNTYEYSLSACMNTVETDILHDIVILQQDYKYLLNHSKAAANYHLYALYIEKLELIVSKSSPYAEHRSISKNIFESIPLALFSQDENPTNVAQICLENKIKLNISSYSNIASTIQELLLFGQHGVIGVPSVQTELKLNPTTRGNIVSIPIDIPLRIATAFFIKKELCETPLGEAILSTLNDAYGKTLEQLY